MGCDIHLHSEIKISGEWQHWTKSRIRRNYTLFAKMGGVRNINNLPILTPLKGLPPDLCFVTRFDNKYRIEDYSNHSWFSVSEINHLYQWMLQELNEYSPEMNFGFPYLFGNGFDNLHNHPSEYPQGLEDARFVFWFDNA